MNLGEKIYQLRVSRNLSQGNLADALEVSRQSISKWETNASVPELDKLIKMSELFGVSLDYLVLDKRQISEPGDPITKVVYVEHPPKPAQNTVGVVLLCFAALLWLLIAAYGDVLSGMILAAPFAACGIICLTVQKYAGLWCAWCIYLFIDFYLRFATGINWSYIILPFVYKNGLVLQLIVAWVLFVFLITLSIITGVASCKFRPSTMVRNLIVAVLCGLTYVATWFVFSLPAQEAQNAVSYPQNLIYYSAVTGFVRHLMLVLAIVFVVRVCSMIFTKIRK